MLIIFGLFLHLKQTHISQDQRGWGSSEISCSAAPACPRLQPRNQADEWSPQRDRQSPHKVIEELALKSSGR